MTQRKKAIIAAVNDEGVLGANLAASPMVKGGVELIAVRGEKSASLAYNAGMDRTDAEVLIFAHQDVYLPPGWDRQLEQAMEAVESRDPEWGALGSIGVTSQGGIVGRVWSTGLNAVVGREVKEPEEVKSFDELVLVFRRGSGLRFDEKLPEFHLYGTDIVQMGLPLGKKSYVFNGPVIHNSRPLRRLDWRDRAAYWYMRRKWWEKLPLPTTVVPVTHWGVPLFRNWSRAMARLALGRTPKHGRHESPARLADELGFRWT